MRRVAVLTVAMLAMAVLPADAGHGAGPHILSVTTLDLRNEAGVPTPDGRLDTVRITFDAVVDEATLQVADFSLQGRTITGYGFGTASGGGSQVDLWILQGSFDTAAKPALTFTAGSLRDPGGNPVSGTVPAMLDGAPPVLVSVAGIGGNTDISARFSEPVQRSGGMTPTDFTYQDQNAAGASSIASVTHASGSATVSLTLDQAVTAGDLSADRVSPSNAITDAAGNAAIVAPITLQAPKAVQVRANVGSDVILLRFNVPVDSASGGSITSAGKFDIVYDNPPETPIEGVDSVVSHQAGGYDVVLKLTRPVSAADVRSLEPARLQVLEQAAKASGTNTPIPFASLPLADKTAPRVIGAFTEDRNRNGFIDALGILWSEPVTAVCADGLVVEGYELDLAGGDTPIVSQDGKLATLPIKERTTSSHDTGLTPNLQVKACSSGSMPFRDRADPPNPALTARIGAIEEADGANPSIITGETHDRDGDGLLDAYVFVFSEPMDNQNTVLTAWTIEGRTITGGQWQDTHKLLIEFDEGPQGDTGDQPSVSYDGDSMQDLAGNKLLAFQGGGFARKDMAAPRIVEAFGDEGSKVLRLVFSEPVEGVTDPDTDPDGPGRGIREIDLSFVNSGGGNPGIVGVRHSKGDMVVFVDTASPLEAVDFGANGDQIAPVPGHIRESNTKPAGERLTVAGQLTTFIEKDVDPPGALADMAWTARGNNATLSFTAPADDGLLPVSGNVTGYRLVLNETLPTDLNITAFKALPAATTRLEPAPPGAVGTTQSIHIENLCPGTGYDVALVALDEDGNPSPLASPPRLQTAADTTPPTGTAEFISGTYRLEDGRPIPTAILDGAIAWTGITDPEACIVQYHWLVDADADTNVTSTAALAESPGVQLDLTPDMDLPADLWLHVAGINGDGLLGETSHFPLRIVQPGGCSPQNATVRDLTVVHQSGFTTITWTDHAATLITGEELQGYQVWLQRAPGEPWELRDVLEVPFTGVGSQRYIDDADIDGQAAYLVTAFYEGGMCQIRTTENGEARGELDQYGHVPADIILPPPVVPTWAWVTLLAISFLVIGGVVMVYGLRRSKLDESWLEEEEEVDHDDPFGSDPITDLSQGEHNVEDDPFADPDAPEAAEAAPAASAAGMMDIVCPACAHQFEVSGSRPLQVRCPNCNAQGVLE